MAARILLVGANSYIGRRVARRLHCEGHVISALARTDEIAAQLAAGGIAPVRCGIADLAEATRGLDSHDACIWLSFVSLRLEQEFLVPVLEAMAATGKAFIFTSGTAVLGIPSPAGEWSEQSFGEDDPFEPPPRQVARVRTERFVRRFADRGMRAMVIRPPLVWGHGGSRQVPWVFESARKTGSALYLGAGLNLYSHVHVDDLARVYALALERGVAGALYHAVAGEENFRSIAEAVAQVAGCSARGVDLEILAAAIGQGPAEVGFAINSRSRSPRTRGELGWTPAHLDLIGDIRNGSYRDKYKSELAGGLSSDAAR